MQMKNRFIFCGQKSARRLLLAEICSQENALSLRASRSVSLTASSGFPLEFPPATPSTGGPIVHGGLDPHGKKLAALHRPRSWSSKGMRTSSRLQEGRPDDHGHQDYTKTTPFFTSAVAPGAKPSRPRHHALEGTFFAPSPVHSFELANLQDDSKVAHACLCVSVV